MLVDRALGRAGHDRGDPALRAHVTADAAIERGWLAVRALGEDAVAVLLVGTLEVDAVRHHDVVTAAAHRRAARALIVEGRRVFGVMDAGVERILDRPAQRAVVAE